MAEYHIAIPGFLEVGAPTPAKLEEMIARALELRAEYAKEVEAANEALKQRAAANGAGAPVLLANVEKWQKLTGSARLRMSKDEAKAAEIEGLTGDAAREWTAKNRLREMGETEAEDYKGQPLQGATASVGDIDLSDLGIS